MNSHTTWLAVDSVLPWLALLLLLLGLGAILWSLRARHTSGLPRGQIIYTDASNWQRAAHSLFSAQHQLAGKPDYVVRDGRSLIPIEVKSSRAPSGGPREGHVLQLAAYCLLVEETERLRPSYGIIRYADNTFRLENNPALRQSLLSALDAMRADLARGESHRSHADPARCRRCGYRDACDERIG